MQAEYDDASSSYSNDNSAASSFTSCSSTLAESDFLLDNKGCPDPRRAVFDARQLPEELFVAGVSVEHAIFVSVDLSQGSGSGFRVGPWADRTSRSMAHTQAGPNNRLPDRQPSAI